MLVMAQGVALTPEETEDLKRRFLLELEEKRGFITYAAKAMPMSLEWWYVQKNNDPEFDKAIRAVQALAKEKKLDVAEGILEDYWKTDPKTIQFWLKQQGRSRGYENVAKKTDDNLLYQKKEMLDWEKEDFRKLVREEAKKLLDEERGQARATEGKDTGSVG